MMARRDCQRSTETWTFGTRKVISTLPASIVPSRGLNRAAPLRLTASGKYITCSLPRLPKNGRFHIVIHPNDGSHTTTVTNNFIDRQIERQRGLCLTQRSIPCMHPC